MRNKRHIFIVMMGAFLMCLGSTALSEAGNFVSKDDRIWAKKALQQEEQLKAIEGPVRTLAVLYFQNKTGSDKLDPLRKGLALMLITDLSKVKEIVLLERVKLQALVEEMGLGVSGLVDPSMAPRVGRLLGATFLVGGDIGKGEKNPFLIDSEVLNVPGEKPLGEPSVDGNLLDGIFKMEKDLVFQIIELLKIELTPEQRKGLGEPITDSLDALMAWFEGVEEADQGNYNKARELFDKAKDADPDFPGDLLSIYSKPGADDGGDSEECAAERNKLMRSTLKKRRW